MPLTLADSLSETLHGFLTCQAVQERNKELAHALVEAANRGEPGPLTAPFGPGRPRLSCQSVIADGDRVALRLTAAADTAVWSLLAQFRFDDEGRVVEYHGAPLPAAA